MPLPRPQSDESRAIREAIHAALEQIERAEPKRDVGATDQVAFQNSWSNIGKPEETAGFYKDASGIVRISGLVTSPGGGGTGNQTVVFTLPHGYWPASHHKFPTRGLSSFTAAGGYVYVKNDGTVAVFLDGIAANAVVTEATLAACSFRASPV